MFPAVSLWFFPVVFPNSAEFGQERERVVTKGFMEREMRYAQEMREWLASRIGEMGMEI